MSRLSNPNLLNILLFDFEIRSSHHPDRLPPRKKQPSARFRFPSPPSRRRVPSLPLSARNFEFRISHFEIHPRLFGGWWLASANPNSIFESSHSMPIPGSRLSLRIQIAPPCAASVFHVYLPSIFRAEGASQSAVCGLQSGLVWSGDAVAMGMGMGMGMGGAPGRSTYEGARFVLISHTSSVNRNIHTSSRVEPAYISIHQRTSASAHVHIYLRRRDRRRLSTRNNLKARK
ncbi:hypothetical protein FIBSPDRAFT_889103 [Athelia psychrophila]|uniref:Uncharacterized protein n=1 Tax=Athelia psychrophila TaxID=1759441 RepID=A0A166MNF5_9AGAM|nr:hypothetical protein FIBSPDRAFT_889103 [Fibularhizoctonia sp. CBS 109695]